MIKYPRAKKNEANPALAGALTKFRGKPAGILRYAGIALLSAVLFTSCPEPTGKIVGKMQTPESMTAIEITPWEFLFVWPEVKNATSYRLIECNENGETTISGWLTENQCTVFYLDDRAPTEYRLVARASHYEDSDPFVLPYTRPNIPGYVLSAPAGLSAIVPESDPRAATLRWELVPGATRYEIYRSSYATEDANFYRLDTAEPVSGPEWTDSGLPNNTQFYYCVRAFNDKLECGPVSENASALTRGAPNTKKETAYPLAQDKKEGFCLYYTGKTLWFSAEASSEGTIELIVSEMRPEYLDADEFMTIRTWNRVETAAEDGTITAEWIEIEYSAEATAAANGGRQEIAIAGLTQGKTYLVSCENKYFGARRFNIMLASGGTHL